MDKTQQNELYAEYCQSLHPQPSPDALQKNLAKFQQEYRQKTLESGRHFIESRHQDYDRKLVEIALNDCKSKKEWQDMEADDQRMMASGFMTTQLAEELLERYLHKITLSYKAERWYMDEICKCETEITNIEFSDYSARRKHNKIRHWTERRMDYLFNLHVQTIKTERYEYLVGKWRGICEQNKIANIAREIAAERNGDGNKYGFNPNMQSCDTAMGMFNDFE